jgi:hypothetical protein
MRTWKELGAEFAELSRSLPYTRLDIQWGSAGDHWHFAGGPLVAVVRERIKTLFALAGAKLLQLDPADLPEDLESVADHELRWLTALRLLSPALERELAGQQLDGDGKGLGWIFSASLRQPAEASANLCLRLESAARLRQSPVEALLDEPELAGAAGHWRRSQEALRADPPDQLNAGKEAINALEAVAKHVSSMPSATLGECLKQLRSSSEIHPALVRSLEGVWGFVNDSPGLRHGSPTKPSLNAAELRYVLATAEAGIALLLA